MNAILLALAITLSASTAFAGSSPLKIMQSYIGLHEVKNRKQLRQIMKFDPRSPWCAAMLTTVMRKAGRKPPPGHNTARSWLHFGKAVRLAQARAGDVVILGRHVGVFHSIKGGKVCLVGGNQKNSIRLSCYQIGRIQGIRR